tara:strand:+ start:665 stop:1177 length:513 start_codon:yes stop_codon:yes gene_type:complete
MIWIAAAIIALVLAYHCTTGMPRHNFRIKYRRGIKYQLVETYVGPTNIFPEEDIDTDWIALEANGRITINAGYGWDGPSGPTIDTHDFMRAALVHDALYQLIRMKMLGGNDLERESFRNAADLEMARIQKEDCMNPIRRFFTYMGVSLFASFAADPANRRKVITAPEGLS